MPLYNHPVPTLKGKRIQVQIGKRFGSTGYNQSVVIGAFWLSSAKIADHRRAVPVQEYNILGTGAHAVTAANAELRINDHPPSIVADSPCRAGFSTLLPKNAMLGGRVETLVGTLMDDFQTRFSRFKVFSCSVEQTS